MSLQLLQRGLRFARQLMTAPSVPIEPAPQRPTPASWSDEALTAANLGHATVLMNFYGLKLLSDPVLGRRCGINVGPSIFGPKRMTHPALKVREIPPLDLLILTHAHMDHLDLWTLRRLRQRCVAVTPARTADLLRGLRFSRVIELGWGEEAEIETAHGAVTVSAHRLRHWGARLQNDDFRGYNCYLLERDGKRVCIAGDTAFTKAAASLRRPGGIDLMAVPIAAYEPWINSHCTPEEAVAEALNGATVPAGDPGHDPLSS